MLGRVLPKRGLYAKLALVALLLRGVLSKGSLYAELSLGTLKIELGLGGLDVGLGLVESELWLLFWGPVHVVLLVH